MPNHPTSIVWTRSSEDWTEDFKKFAVKTRVIPAPAIRTEAFPLIIWPESRNATTVITSKGSLNVVLHSEKGKHLLNHSREVITFGAKTAERARSRGINAHCPEGIHSAEELAQWLLQRLHFYDEILVLGPDKPAFPIAAYLSERGARAKHVSLYRTCVLHPQLSQNCLTGTQPKVLALASPSAAESLAEPLSKLTPLERSRWTLLSIGKTTGRRAEHLIGPSLISPRSTAESLIHASESLARLLDQGARKVAFFDGVCNLCNSWVDWCLRNNPSDRIRFASLQSPLAATLLDPNLRAARSSVIVIDLDKSRVLQRTDAVISIAAELDSPTARLFSSMRWIPSFLRDTAYRVVAKSRYHIFGKAASCRLPTAKERGFLMD
jgi:predicted DCC family thiol-disulfide oxidoreductase YuxK/uroporphyrinogen-III synthase